MLTLTVPLEHQCLLAQNGELMMAVGAKDIVTLVPDASQIKAGVVYAVKSIPYTYNRMAKEPWKRAARTARGKVNEVLVLEALRGKNLRLDTEDKSYRDFDASDYILSTDNRSFSVDLKTFHILNQFVKAPRQPLTLVNLTSSVDSAGPWYNFYPMLVPLDYKKPKDLFIFAVSVEATYTRGDKSALSLPWRAFPETPQERFLADVEQIRSREISGEALSVTVAWPAGLAGRASLVYERNAKASEQVIELDNRHVASLEAISSLISIGLDDVAHDRMKNNPGHAITLEVFKRGNGTVLLASSFSSNRFREIFPRSEYKLHLIGWLTKAEFISRSEVLPRGTPCYFYPPGQDIAPATKTDNRYVLPQFLNPIDSLRSLR
jgi:hypothetical protein